MDALTKISAVFFSVDSCFPRYGHIRTIGTKREGHVSNKTVGKCAQASNGVCWLWEIGCGKFQGLAKLAIGENGAITITAATSDVDNEKPIVGVNNGKQTYGMKVLIVVERTTILYYHTV